jgi:hypothetical protein
MERSDGWGLGRQPHIEHSRPSKTSDILHNTIYAQCGGRRFSCPRIAHKAWVLCRMARFCRAALICLSCRRSRKRAKQREAPPRVWGGSPIQNKIPAQRATAKRKTIAMLFCCCFFALRQPARSTSAQQKPVALLFVHPAFVVLIKAFDLI